MLLDEGAPEGAEALLKDLGDGSVVALGGIMLSRRPVALCRALAAAPARRLRIVTFSAGFETDLLVGAGKVEVVATTYAGLAFFGPAPEVRAAVERGRIELRDETELTLAVGLTAGALGTPWIPLRRGVLGTDLPDVRDDLRHFEDGETGETLLAVPAIEPDLCLLHVPYADRLGNAAFVSSPGLDCELAAASRRTIISADEVVETGELREVAGPADLISFEVEAVLACPGGARPLASQPHYSFSTSDLCDYLDERDARDGR